MTTDQRLKKLEAQVSQRSAPAYDHQAWLQSLSPDDIEQCTAIAEHRSMRPGVPLPDSLAEFSRDVNERLLRFRK